MNIFTATTILIFLTDLASCAQNKKEITAIEFTSLSRAYYEQVLITPDSLCNGTREAGGEIKTTCRPTTTAEWNELLNSLNGVSISEMGKLKSPSMKRAYDGALHSSLRLTTKDNQSWNHSFDDDDPHEQLRPLLIAIRKLESN